MRFTFYRGRENWEVLGLASNGQPLEADDIAAITAARIELADGRVADSEADPDAFDFGMPGRYGSAAITGIGINLALVFDPMPPVRARLVIFDPDHLGGFVWADGFEVEVIA